MELFIKRRYHLRLPLLVRCGHFYLLANQIAGLFDHKYLWKESNNPLDYLHSHQGKVASETTSFGWVWPVVLHIHSGSKILWLSVSVIKIRWSHCFLHGDSHQRKVLPKTTIFCLGVVCCVSHPIRLKDSLISNETEKNQTFLNGCNDQAKVAFKTTTCFGMARFVFDHSNCRILCYRYLCKKSIDTFVWPMPIFYLVIFIHFFGI